VAFASLLSGWRFLYDKDVGHWGLPGPDGSLLDGFVVPRPANLASLLDALRQSELVDPSALDALRTRVPFPAEIDQALALLVRHGLLTPFHVRHLREGRIHGFILGRYRVLHPLGRGGMGLVYLAERRDDKQKVALKVLRTQLHRLPGARERFAREGRATATLDHPNLVRIFDVQEQGTTHFLVMEYVQGQSLNKLLAQQGRLPVDQAVEVIRQAAAGLQHAHERGLVHRDIKPSNLMLDDAGRVRLLDMGLARFFEDRTDNLTERLGGGVLGSPDYLAPELARQPADCRSDLYALGATFYCLLMGEPPFALCPGSAKMLAHQRHAVISPSQRDPRILPEISAVVLRLLAKAPEDRFGSAKELQAALEALPARAAVSPTATARPRTGRFGLVRWVRFFFPWMGR
jgi:serine/threonine protein kinase